MLLDASRRSAILGWRFWCCGNLDDGQHCVANDGANDFRGMESIPKRKGIRCGAYCRWRWTLRAGACGVVDAVGEGVFHNLID